MGLILNHWMLLLIKFKRVFGFIKKLLKTNWSESPFTYGAYSRERNTSHKDIFNKPEGRVYFAGEHTAERPASTQGAWISGRDRANQIIKKLSKK